MKNILLTLMVVGIIGCSDRSQDNSTELPEPYMFATSENSYIIEKHCLLQNAQQCKTENCNAFIQELCLSKGDPYPLGSSEFIPIDVMSDIYSLFAELNIGKNADDMFGENIKIIDPYTETLRDPSRAQKIIDDADTNEQYKNIYECKFLESQKCKTNGCNDFVSGYCENFTYFKGEKLIANNLRLERSKQETIKIYSRINLILSNPDSYPATEVAEVFCYNAGETFVYKKERVKFSCEEWFLMDDLKRKERNLPLEKEYQWNINPSNPERIKASSQENLNFIMNQFLQIY